MLKPKLAAALVLFLVLSSHIYSQWSTLNSGTSVQLYSVNFTNSLTGFAAGDNGKVLKTTNAGVTWTVSTILDTSVNYRSIYFVDQNTGYIAGRVLLFNPVFAQPKIIKTTNAGATWTSVINDSGYTLLTIIFLNANTGFAAGGLYGSGPYKIIMTTNGGSTWQSSSDNNPYIRFITFQNINTGYACSGSYVLKTINGGSNWNILSSFSLPITNSVLFLNSTTGYTVGGNFTVADSLGAIYKTSDGGSSWNTSYSDNRGIINDIKFVNGNTGFAAGSLDPLYEALPGRILKTTNSGNNWFIDTVFSSHNGLTSLFFTDQNTGYAVGNNGVILKTTNSGSPIGIQPISTEVPDRFFLNQNYPNPFNPATKIKFAIPKSALTKVSVYDILGREVSVIVNEELKTGIYSVSWNAENFPSGVYFYKIKSGDFTSAKKMILLK